MKKASHKNYDGFIVFPLLSIIIFETSLYYHTHSFIFHTVNMASKSREQLQHLVTLSNAKTKRFLQEQTKLNLSAISALPPLEVR